jgi:alkylation response protein AidB-like acyl-CoA dehydrogenase
MDADAAKDLVTRTPAPVVAGSMAPLGRAVATATSSGGAGYRLDGRWPFSSGCLHADWLIGAFVAPDGAGGMGTQPGQGPPRFAFFPADAATVHQTWDVAGLCGTGSHDISVEALVVPRELTISPFTEPAGQPGPLYHGSFFSFLMIMMAGFPLGVARRALDEFHALAHRKKRLPAGTPLAEDPLIQTRIARCTAALAAARALVFSAVGEVTAAARAHGAVDPLVRARLAGAVLHAMETARTVVDTAFRCAGASALYDSQPLQRCFRDIHAALQHVAFGPDAVSSIGRIELGLPAPTFLV